MRPAPGDAIPSWTLECVSAERMRTVAAIFRDPNPVHWDRAAVAARGAGERVINQSPINVSYVANMLMAWAGPTSIRRLRVEFPGAVFDGETVVARGIVRAVEREGTTTLAECEVWLEKADGARAVEGSARVVVPSD